MNINDISPRFLNSAVRIYDKEGYRVGTSTAAKCLFDSFGELRVNKKFRYGKPLELEDIYNGNIYKLEKITLFWMILDALDKRNAAKA